MFRKVSGITRQGVAQLNVDKRFEYFHNYWQIAQPKDSDLFFDEVRIESHRSLLIKIDHQLRYNFKNCTKRFNYLFAKHEFFSPNNIIIKNPHILNLRNAIVENFASGKDVNRDANQARIIKEFEQLKNKILTRPDYSIKLAKRLIKTIITNKPLDSQVKADIRFLVSAFIVELYHHGYGLDYIAAIPDILLSGDHYRFPHEKTLEDFDYDNEQYKDYVEQEKTNRSIDKVLMGIVNLVRRPMKDLYFVFKVDNIYLFDPQSIKIGEVEFYNPQLQSRIQFWEQDIQHKTEFIEIENFYAPGKVGEVGANTNFSNCNAVVQVKHRCLLNIPSAPDALFQAYQKVVKSVEMLSELHNRHSGTQKGKGRVDIHKHFIIHSNNRMGGGYDFDLLSENFMRIDFSDPNRNGPEGARAFQKDLDILKKLDLKTEMGQKLMHVLSIISKLTNNPESFNFKDLWIAWESIMGTNAKQHLIKFAQAVYQYRYKKDYLRQIKLFLHIKLKRHYSIENPSQWSLSDADLNRLGLERRPNQVVDMLHFKRRYQELDTLVPIEMIKDTTARVHELVNNPEAFFKKLDIWVENTVEEFYIERNTEVHRNIENGLSKFKLKKNMLDMSRWLVFMMINFSDKRNPEKIDLILNKIKTAAKNVQV